MQDRTSCFSSMWFVVFKDVEGCLWCLWIIQSRACSEKEGEAGSWQEDTELKEHFTYWETVSRWELERKTLLKIRLKFKRRRRHEKSQILWVLWEKGENDAQEGNV